MCGSFKSLYLQTRRKGIATLSPSPTHRSLRVDERDNSRIGTNKGSSSKQPNPGHAKCRRTHVIIHIRNTLGCERGASRRTSGGRTQIPGSEAGILHIYCPHTMQIPVPTLSKNSICGLHGIPETTTLLSRVFNHGGLRSTN